MHSVVGFAPSVSGFGTALVRSIAQRPDCRYSLRIQRCSRRAPPFFDECWRDR